MKLFYGGRHDCHRCFTAKKERILIAAEDVFRRRGYTKATLDEIIALADTGKGTLYKYFGNKDNLFTR